MHDGGGSHDNTAKAVPQIIAQLRAQGYRFVTMTELLDLASAGKEKVAKASVSSTNS
jgi:peptidoglycan/xylan/chitin deacetylase (PgdA/CDA1 family)